MDEKTLIGSITFSNIANPNTWDIGEQKALVFSCPSEAKRGEELFTAMQDAAFKAGREAGMRRAASELEMTNGEILLMAGELTAGELRAVKAVMAAKHRAILAAIGEGK